MPIINPSLACWFKKGSRRSAWKRGEGYPFENGAGNRPHAVHPAGWQIGNQLSENRAPDKQLEVL
jgi:hypothetical protein